MLKYAVVLLLCSFSSIKVVGFSLFPWYVHRFFFPFWPLWQCQVHHKFDQKKVVFSHLCHFPPVYFIGKIPLWVSGFVDGYN